MADFAAHLAETRADLYVDSIRLDSEPLVLMSHGWRAYAAEGSLRQRVLRRSRRWYLGHPPQMENRVGLSIPSSSLMNGTPWEALKARTGLAITRLAQKRIGFDHPFSQEFPCYVGSTWFTASQRGCEYMLQKASDATLTAYFARMHMGDEIFFPTIFSNSGLTRACAPHYIARFDNARPTWLQIDDLDEVLSSKLFFARKFPVDPQSPVRLELRRRLDWPRASTGKPARESA